MKYLKSSDSLFEGSKDYKEVFQKDIVDVWNEVKWLPRVITTKVNSSEVATRSLISTQHTY